MRVLTILRRRLKVLFDRIGSQRFKNSLLQALPFWIASLITGLAAVAYSKLFSLAEKGTQFIFQRNSYLFFLITPVCFIVAWWLVKRFSTYARGSGIPQVIKFSKF
jgi:H+/Cl- antiporter ClcA